MSTGPSFIFYIPGETGPISIESPLWHLPLAGNSADFSKDFSAADAATGPGPTIGDYFTAARAFLEKKNSRLLEAALSVLAGKGQENDTIQRVELFLEKHGAFYHPLRVKIFSETGRAAALVLNGAVSRPGLALIEDEYQLLARLEKQVATAYTPRVFGVGIQALKTSAPEKKGVLGTGSEPRNVGFLVGEWFEGFREFHISNFSGKPQIAVWASNGDIDYLPLEKAAALYEQIAHILTAYYNVDTGEQVFPWHHAAGDFVVNPAVEGFPVKLITVRGYKSLIGFEPDGPGPGDHMLPALLFFFLNLTLRIRMDRLDGVGSLVFLDENVLKAAVNGFLRGLEDKEKQFSAPEDPEGLKGTGGLKDIFARFMANFNREQIEAILTRLIDAWPINASEQTLAGVHLKSHAACIHSLFKNR